MSASMDILIDEYTSPIDVFVDANTPLDIAQELLKESGHRHMPVVDGNKPVGLLTHKDLNLYQYEHENESPTVRDAIDEEPYCVPYGSSIDEVALKMSENKIESALVIGEEGELEGIFTSVDALNALVEVVRGDIQ